jgi:plastocyanin
MVRRALAACIPLSVLAAFAFAALPAGADPSRRDEGLATLRGEVRVLRPRLLGGLEPSDDRGDVLVYVTGFSRPPPDEIARLDQRSEQFRPRILPVVTGQEVTFPNHDRIYHNVFSVSPIHPFDLGQYRSVDPPRTEVFERPGLVPVFCNIHPQMIAYVVVLENDAFAVTGSDGRFEISGVPPGRHVVHAWTPGAERRSQEVEVASGAALELSFELEARRVPPHTRKDGSPYPRPGYEADR